jgi:hypothetical protein
MLDVQINDHLNEMNTGGGEKDGEDGGVPEVNMGSDEAGERSPPKKKKKKDKDKKRKSSKKETGEKEKDIGAESILKPCRFSKDGSEKRKQEEAEKSSAKEAAEKARAKAKENEEKRSRGRCICISTEGMCV